MARGFRMGFNAMRDDVHILYQFSKIIFNEGYFRELVSVTDIQMLEKQ